MICHEPESEFGAGVSRPQKSTAPEHLFKHILGKSLLNHQDISLSILYYHRGLDRWIDKIYFPANHI